MCSNGIAVLPSAQNPPTLTPLLTSTFDSSTNSPLMANSRTFNEPFLNTSQLIETSTHLIDQTRATKLGVPSSVKAECYLKCEEGNIYESGVFWAYVVLMSIGLLGFNIVSSTSDAVCFDILGEGNEVQYGAQRVFGTLGYGFTALCGGWAIDIMSADCDIKDYSPAFIILLVFGALDLVCCYYMRVPRIKQSKNIFQDVSKVMKKPYVKSFLVFAILAGFCEGFAIYNLFWYLEDLAKSTNTYENIKLLQGLTVAAQCLFGEVVFFSFSDKILNKLGYGHCLSFCFVCYFLRLGAIGLIPSPWWILPIELLGQGPTYALTYTTVVAYASAISPPGTSATMQGVMAGAYDGFGFALASFIGGILYTDIGGSYTFITFSLIALICAIAHAIVYHYTVEKLQSSLEYEPTKIQDNKQSSELEELKNLS
ncbi:hypothetical protein M8J77_010217 [Diaphorina citri]|nr:hypothetical protein M8J77_010217 [Diaphorina citri]